MWRAAHVPAARALPRRRLLAEQAGETACSVSAHSCGFLCSYKRVRVLFDDVGDVQAAAAREELAARMSADGFTLVRKTKTAMTGEDERLVSDNVKRKLRRGSVVAPDFYGFQKRETKIDRTSHFAYPVSVHTRACLHAACAARSDGTHTHLCFMLVCRPG